MISEPWPADTVERFKALWATETPVHDICIELGKSARAIAHKRLRLGLPKRESHIAANARWDRYRAANPLKPFSKPQNKPRAATSVKLGQLPLPEGCKPVGLIERSDTGCCFIVDRHEGQHRYCNLEGKKHGESHYCDYHQSVRFEVRG